MQRVHWISSNKKLTWGLGFYLDYDDNGTVTTGHDGSCPGYVSVVMIDPKKKLGVTVMVNAQGVDVYKYSSQIFSLLGKAIPGDSTTKNVDLSIYRGRYDNYTWWGETIVIPYKGKLIVSSVPANNLSDNIREYQYVGKDTFRRIRSDDKKLAEELVFERDEKGKVKSFLTFSRRQRKIE